MIRVINLMIRLLSTVNLRQRRRTSYELDVPCPFYILEKNCKPIRFTIFFQNVKRMRWDPIHIFIWKCEPDDLHLVYILKKNYKPDESYPI